LPNELNAQRLPLIIESMTGPISQSRSIGRLTTIYIVYRSL